MILKSNSSESLFKDITTAPCFTSLPKCISNSGIIIRAKEVKLIMPCESELNKKGLDLIYCSTTEDIVFIFKLLSCVVGAKIKTICYKYNIKNNKKLLLCVQ